MIDLRLLLQQVLLPESEGSTLATELRDNGASSDPTLSTHRLTKCDGALEYPDSAIEAVVGDATRQIAPRNTVGRCRRGPVL